MPEPIKIAFVPRFISAYTDRLARGVVHAASNHRERGLEITIREFELRDDKQEIPQGFEEWAPDVVITYLTNQWRPLFDLMKRDGRPLIHNAGVTLADREAAVLMDAVDSYRCIHKHFRSIGRTKIAAYFASQETSDQKMMDRYRVFCESEGEDGEILYCPHGIVDDPLNPQGWPNASGAIAEWLLDIEER